MAEKKYMIIDGIRAEFTDEKNILQVIHKVGIHVPTFCYYSDMSIYGACRMCVVEDERGGIIASCSTPPKNKMVIKTNTGRLHDYRKMILELLLASHCRDCTVCEKNGNCRLQMLAARFRLTDVRFPNTHPERMIDDSSLSIVRDPSKCILCGDCVRMCNEVQHVGAIDFANRGANMVVTPAFNRKIAETDCVNCGQCAAVCPTAAITIKKDLKQVWQALYAPNKRVVAQVAPAVRVAIGEEFGLKPGKNSIGKIYTALRMCGFDTVFDTSVAADLTIVEEAAELVRKLENGENTYPNGNKYPLFTSCCPGWVRFVETKHRDMLPYVSTCKSPMEMFGAVIKEYYKPADKEAGLETVSVAVMPCVAKKYEAARDEFKRNDVPDVDYVITTKELILMIKELGINWTILGHSERRLYANETSLTCNQKIHACLENDVKVIYCVGETLAQFEGGLTRNVVKEQMIVGLMNLKKEDVSNIVIAYEPVWSIGTGKNASEEIETPDSRTMKGGALWHILRKNRSENIIGMN